jgi:hypothetical protein
VHMLVFNTPNQQREFEFLGMTPFYPYFLYNNSLKFCMRHFFAGTDMRIFLHVMDESEMTFG